MKFLAASLALLLMAPEAHAALKFSVSSEDAGERAYRLMTEGRDTIFAAGEFEPGDALRLRGYLKSRGIKAAKISFNSPGGSLMAGLEVGEAIRELGLDTEIAQNGGVPGAMCASACAYAFAGGVNRYYDSKTERLGIHQFYGSKSNQLNPGETQLVSGLLVAYLLSMGVDANAFALSTTAAGNEMVWLSSEQAEQLGFSNNGVQPTTAEILTVGMRPYLRLEQVRRQGHARVLLTCLARGEFDMKAGVVATHVEAAFHSSMSQRSYVELDGKEALVEGPGATVVYGEVMWLHRKLDDYTLRKLLRADKLDIWSDGSGAVRWGAMLDLRPVRRRIATYVADCQRTPL